VEESFEWGSSTALCTVASVTPLNTSTSFYLYSSSRVCSPQGQKWKWKTMRSRGSRDWTYAQDDDWVVSQQLGLTKLEVRNVQNLRQRSGKKQGNDREVEIEARLRGGACNKPSSHTLALGPYLSESREVLGTATPAVCFTTRWRVLVSLLCHLSAALAPAKPSSPPGTSTTSRLHLVFRYSRSPCMKVGGTGSAQR